MDKFLIAICLVCIPVLAHAAPWFILQEGTDSCVAAPEAKIPESIDPDTMANFLQNIDAKPIVTNMTDPVSGTIIDFTIGNTSAEIVFFNAMYDCNKFRKIQDIVNGGTPAP